MRTKGHMHMNDSIIVQWIYWWYAGYRVSSNHLSEAYQVG